MLRLCLQFQGAGATGAWAAQFDDLNVFGGVAGNDATNGGDLFFEPFRRR